MIKIYESTEVVDRKKISEWLQLEVVNQWAISSKPLYHKNGIIFELYHNITTSDTTNTRQIVTDFPSEIKEEIVRRGYTLYKAYE